MAGKEKDLLDYIDENLSSITHTPVGQIRLRSLNLSRSRRNSSNRKSRKLFTPNKSTNVDDLENVFEPRIKKMRMSLPSSSSLNATMGNGSHIDSSFDVVDVTPGIDVQKSITFRSYLKNCTALPGRNLSLASKTMEHIKPLAGSNAINGNILQQLPCSPVNEERTYISNEEVNAMGHKQNDIPRVSGIKSLWSPVAANRKDMSSMQSAGLSSLVQIDRMGSVSQSKFQTPKRNENDKPQNSPFYITSLNRKSKSPMQFTTPSKLDELNTTHTKLQTPSKSNVTPRIQKSAFHITSINKSKSPMQFTPPAKFDELHTSQLKLHTPNRTENVTLRSQKSPFYITSINKCSSQMQFTPPTKLDEKYRVAQSKCNTPIRTADFTSRPQKSSFSITSTNKCNDETLSPKLYGTCTLSQSKFQTPTRATDITNRFEQSLLVNKEDDELPDTQPICSLLLKGVIAYVEVRNGGDNRSMGIKAHLRSLGATVRDKFTNDVTHVIFNEGLWSTYKKAMKKKVHLVSVLWIEECKNAQTIVSERLYPPLDVEKYEFPNLLKKFRKVRSLQPDFEELGEQKITRRRRKKLVPISNKSELDVELPESLMFQKKVKIPGFLQNVSNENGLVRTLLSVADIGPEYEEVVNRPSSPTLSEEEDFSIPLAVRLLRKILTPQSSPEISVPSREAPEGSNTKLTGDYVNRDSGVVNIEETPKRQFGQSVEKRKSILSSQFNADNVVPRTNTETHTVDSEWGSVSQLQKTPVVEKFNKDSLVKSSTLAIKNNPLFNGTENHSCIEKLMDNNNLGTHTSQESDIRKGIKRKNIADVEVIVPALDIEKSEKREMRGTKRKCSIQQTMAGNKTDKFKKIDSTNVSEETETLKDTRRKYITRQSIVENSASKYEEQAGEEASCSKFDEKLKNGGIHSKHKVVQFCGTQEVDKESFPDKSLTNKGMTVKKRKLLSLSQSSSPEVLTVSPFSEEIDLTSVKYPYKTEEQTSHRRKRKAESPAGETSAMELTPCAANIPVFETRRRSKQICKKFDFSSNGRHEVVSKVTCSQRRSSGEFVKSVDTPLLKKEGKSQKTLEKKVSTLVCTGLQRHEVEVVAAVVKKLGGLEIEANVSAKTTHVVTQGPRRTINLLKGIARGCWILLQDWVLQSLAADHWIEEDKFELTDFSLAIKQCRMQRMSFGPVYKLDLFSSYGNIFVSKCSAPPKQDLEELIKLCGGHVVNSMRSASLLVGKGSLTRHINIKNVNEKWVLDSIQFNTLKPVVEYEIK